MEMQFISIVALPLTALPSLLSHFLNTTNKMKIA